MTVARSVALLVLGSIIAAGLLAPRLAPWPYDRVFRELPDAPPSPRFPIGTDDIGRDRLSRLLYGTRVSAVLAPAAALVSILLAFLISIASAARSRILEHTFAGLTTVCLSLPWIFLFIILRAELPLDTRPGTSVALTFGLMGLAGSAWPGRVLATAVIEMRESGWVIQARAAGMRSWRIALVHFWPHLRAIALAQFRTLVPAYVLSEASLGLLGLGVPEPLPSWGNLLRDLQHPDLVRANPWILAPLGLLVAVMICLEVLQSPGEVSA